MATMQGVPGQTYAGLSGEKYTADETGLIQGVAGNDVLGLVAGGCCPLPPGPDLPSSPEVGSKNRGGRPAEHGWDGFWIEIVRVSERSPEGLPSRDELRNHMRRFVEGWGKQPDDRAIREKLQRLYAALTRNE